MTAAPLATHRRSVCALTGTAVGCAWPATRRWLGVLWGWWVVCLLASAAHGQTNEAGGGIFVCVDAQGRRITSDRPIPECLAREQRELSPAGTTLRIIPPSLTADERAREEARAQQEAVQKARLLEERRRDRALLMRYQSEEQHQAERRKQLEVVLGAQEAIRQGSLELQKQREVWLTEMEFYKANPAQAPAWLKRNLRDNQEQQASQQRLLVIQADEMARINARFDEELVRLRQLWGHPPPPRRP